MFTVHTMEEVFGKTFCLVEPPVRETKAILCGDGDADEAWLRSVGFKDIHNNEFWIQLLSADGVHSIAISKVDGRVEIGTNMKVLESTKKGFPNLNDEGDDWNACIHPGPKSKFQIRCLAEFLGIPLSEPV